METYLAQGLNQQQVDIGIHALPFAHDGLGFGRPDGVGAVPLHTFGDELIHCHSAVLFVGDIGDACGLEVC